MWCDWREVITDLDYGLVLNRQKIIIQTNVYPVQQCLYDAYMQH